MQPYWIKIVGEFLTILWKLGFSTNIYLFKVNIRNTRKRCEIFLKLTIKTPEWLQWRRSGVFIINFKYISRLFLVFLLLTLNKLLLAGLSGICKIFWGIANTRERFRHKFFCNRCNIKQCELTSQPILRHTL